MTTKQLSIDDVGRAERVAHLEHLLAVELANVLEYAAGSRELAPADFDAGLAAVRYLAGEIRWLTLGEQAVPF